jgi:hypothetical protein
VTQVHSHENTPDGTAGRTFGRSFGSPVMTAIPGFFLFSVLGVVLQILPMPGVASLPSPVGRALLAALVSVVAFGGASYLARRFYGGGGTAAYLMGAPLAVVFISALFVAAKGHISILSPATAVLWNSSAFEVASWGAFGSAIGFWIAEASTEKEVATAS